MSIKNLIYLIIILLIFASCSKENVKKSSIKEKSLELQVKEAYEEGKKELESGDVYLGPKKLKKQKFCFLNQNGHQNQL